MTTTATKEAPVIIGNNVSIGPNVSLISVSEPNNSPELMQIKHIKENCIKHEAIIIEDEVWLGAKVTVLPGVKIGHHSVIGAGAVVTSDVEPYSIYVGVPARKVTSLERP